MDGPPCAAARQTPLPSRHLMSKAWIRAKQNEFARDVLRDFCLSRRALEQCFTAYETTGRMGFEELRELAGLEMNKGLLWRLKDTAHLLFRPWEGGGPAPEEQLPGAKTDDGLMGRFLDWALGYIFHETVKLKEDVHQLEHYVPWFTELVDAPLNPAQRAQMERLMVVQEQTLESISREMRRIRYIASECLELFPACYGRFAASPLLARFLYAHRTLVQETFGDRYAALIAGVYGDAPETLSLLAARSLREGGWVDHAAAALAEAHSLNPHCADLAAETELLEGVRRLQRRT